MKKRYLKYLIIKRNSNKDEIYEYKEEKSFLKWFLDILKAYVVPIITFITPILILGAYCYEYGYTSYINVSKGYILVDLESFTTRLWLIIIFIVFFASVSLVMKNAVHDLKDKEKTYILLNIILWEIVVCFYIIFIILKFNNNMYLVILGFSSILFLLWSRFKAILKFLKKKWHDKSKKKKGITIDNNQNEKEKRDWKKKLIIFSIVIIFSMFIFLLFIYKILAAIILTGFIFFLATICSGVSYYIMFNMFSNENVVKMTQLFENSFQSIIAVVLSISIVLGLVSYIDGRSEADGSQYDRYVVFQEKESFVTPVMKMDIKPVKGKDTKGYYLYYVVYENKEYLCLKPIVDKKGKFIEYKIDDEGEKENNTTIVKNPKTTSTYIVNKSKVDVVYTFSNPKNVKKSLKNDSFTISN